MSGVLDSSYAERRRDRPELAFRLEARARIATDAVRRFLAPRPPTLAVLDLGCAEGRTLEVMGRLLLQLEGTTAVRGTGVERAEGLLARASPLDDVEGLTTRYVQADVGQLPRCVERESFFLVSALALLEHLAEPLAAMRQARECLAPGGLFVATCPHPTWDRISTRLGLLDADQHEDRLDLRRLASLAEEAGMEVVETRRFMWAPIAFLPYLGIGVGPERALRIDRRLAGSWWARPFFVNQCLVARRADDSASG